MRGAIYDLRLGAEEQRPFGALIAELVDVQRAIAGERRIELETDQRLRDLSLGRTGAEVLRVVGEALVNARRHSGAGTIRVRAVGDGEVLCVEVVDDGRGFDTTATPASPSATGLAGMRERAALLGGDLDIHSSPETGTHVRLEVAVGADPTAALRPVRILLVEDHAAVREALSAMFDHEPDLRVVGQAASLHEARQKLHDVDVAVLDLGLPDGYGGDLIKELRRVNVRAQALVLTATPDRREIARAVQSGAAAVLHKAVHLDEVVDAVRRLHAGETLMPLEEIEDLLRFAARERDREQDEREALESLTPREVEVLQVLAEGLGSQAVANRLFISRRTERNHVANILTKLNVHSRLQALLLALRHGVVEARRPDEQHR